MYKNTVYGSMNQLALLSNYRSLTRVIFKRPLEILFRPLWVLHTAEEGRTNKKEPQSKAALVREVIMNVLAIDE